MSNEGDGQVSLKNILISKIKCHYLCKRCFGAESNQCIQCFYGNPQNGICNQCPSDSVLRPELGCRTGCDISQPFYYNNQCLYYQSLTILFADYILLEERTNIKVIQDYTNTDQQPIHFSYDGRKDIIGLFKFNQGLERLINEINSDYGTYLIGIKVEILIFDDIPKGGSISLKINNTYKGSIYNDGTSLKFHKLKLISIELLASYQQYTKSMAYFLQMFVDIPQYHFTLSIVGNYGDSFYSWAYEQLYITSGYCPINCELCELPFQCKICKSSFYNYRDGQCTVCSKPYQKLKGSYCQDVDDETPYSKYLVQEYKDLTNDPSQFSQYSIVSQNGINFMKGSDILYSIFNNIRIFGGQLVWSQVKFLRVHQIFEPHHSITIVFYIVFGPSFPQTSQFIYTIEQNDPVIKKKGSSQITKIYEKIQHSESSLIMQWECQGSQNEPYQAYCGFYNYYIAVHYCKPYCSKCNNQDDCIQWNPNYDPNIVKFSQAECNNNQYFDQRSLQCYSCPEQCLTCLSQFYCLTCQESFIQSKLGCICKTNQYEQSNYCYDCPIECEQCSSSKWCTECSLNLNRIQSNGNCVCINGYTSYQLDPFCYKCSTLHCHICDKVNGLECYSCQNGYRLIENNCFSICGDGIITEDEQCDDGNLINEDGCHSCLYNCQHSCQFCINGICVECYDGYILISSKCYSICGLDQTFNKGKCQTSIFIIQIIQQQIH
ncbi:unnamed protein product [Paramecium sonneborni]|uniref:Insulin-like growth factor binding protein, N-terminal n=1 Tax=Paramecium sonneborni TaxID=65129 RepID=A0A8S1MDT1_9CILI|nr:unnamed protein product [Paramecium sonneborni]